MKDEDLCNVWRDPAVSGEAQILTQYSLRLMYSPLGLKSSALRKYRCMIYQSSPVSCVTRFEGSRLAFKPLRLTSTYNDCIWTDRESRHHFIPS